MALPLRAPSVNSGGWLKPGDFIKCVAVLIEVHEFERQRPGSAYGPKDSALCDVTAFNTGDDLKNGTPDVTHGVRIEHQELAKALSTMAGAATIVTIYRGVPKGGNQAPWLMKQVTDPAIIAAIEAYAEKRDVGIAKAMDDAPPF